MTRQPHIVSLPDAPMLRLLVCGDRNWSDWAAIVAVLRKLDPKNTLLVTGGARGADAIAERAGKALGFEARVVMPADWDRFGRSAGPRRNGEMLRVILAGAPEHDRLVIAFHDNIAESKGTANMVKKARRAGVAVKIVSHRRKN